MPYLQEPICRIRSAMPQFHLLDGELPIRVGGTVGMQRTTVVINGEQYYSLQELQLIAPVTRVEAIRVVEGGESALIQESLRAISDSSWVVGSMASQWLRKHASGRTDTDFGSLVGLSPDQVYQRRRVWETFGDVKESHPKLRWSHFFAALDWDDAAECLTWASDVQANVPEMRAWRRAQNGQDLSASDPDRSI